MKAKPLNKAPLFDFWKVDKIAYEKGQAPTWVNDFLTPQSFFKQDEGELYWVDLTGKGAGVYEGDYLLKAEDEEKDDGKIKKGKITGKPAADFEENYEVIK